MKHAILALLTVMSLQAYDLGQTVADNVVQAEGYWGKFKTSMECEGQWNGPKGFKQDGYVFKHFTDRNGKKAVLRVPKWIKCD